MKLKQICALKQNDGFTYIELLLSLFILVMILFITGPTLKIFSHIELKEKSFDIDVFLEDIFETELEKEDFIVDTNRLSFKTKNGVITYRLSNNRIVKSIDDKGFIPLMYNVSEFSIKDKSTYILLTIKEGDNYYTINIKK